MIILKTLKWSNTFSYGKDNVLNFDEHPIVQLVGKNGHGKSSIPLILEEVLYNKNSKGIKKGDIINRYTSDKSYSIELEFEKDGESYTIKTVRGSTQTVRFIQNGEDISAHTATNTFKLIEEVLGFDHRTFSQLIYQSSTSSLEFLTATDTNRKKFLIDLLNLTKYVDAFEVFKELAKTISDEVKQIDTQISTTQAWLDKHSKVSLEEKNIREVPEQPSKDQELLADIKTKLKDIDSLNKRINQNNEYKKLLNNIPVGDINKKVEEVEGINDLVKSIAEQEAIIKAAKAAIKKHSDAPDTCPTCKQSIDNSSHIRAIEEQQEVIIVATELLETDKALLLDKKSQEQEYKRVTKLKEEWESYHSFIDESLPEEIFDKTELSDQITSLSDRISTLLDEIKNVTEDNNKRIEHNTKVKLIIEQMDSMKEELQVYNDKLQIVSSRLNIVSLLQKTFSTNGLIAYKIECLVKDLEALANKYLSELADGRFQLSFVVVSDKLNVVINDNGINIDILALSSGERAKVNTATLLAIRKLMQSLSNARINLLVLDETIETLDVEGKEKLVEVLLNEEHLNTILVSHGYTHPLLEKLLVIKENNISRIE